MTFQCQYITEAALDKILYGLSLPIDAADKQDLANRAVGDLESGLCARFVVPLLCEDGTAFSNAPQFTQTKIANAFRAKLRSIIALDHHRNTTIESTERFINVHEKEFDGHIEDLNDPKKVYGLQLTDQAQGAMEPLQSIGLGRADNDLIVDGHHYE